MSTTTTFMTTKNQSGLPAALHLRLPDEGPHVGLLEVATEELYVRLYAGIKLPRDLACLPLLVDSTPHRGARIAQSILNKAARVLEQQNARALNAVSGETVETEQRASYARKLREIASLSDEVWDKTVLHSEFTVVTAAR